MERARFYDPRTGITQEIDVEYYAGEFSEPNFWEKVKSKIKSAGLQLIYKAMQLYYATENPNCPTKVKAGISSRLSISCRTSCPSQATPTTSRPSS